MNLTPLTKEESAENIKGMFKILKLMIILIDIAAAVIIFIITPKQLSDIGAKILSFIIVCGVSWLPCIFVKIIANTTADPNSKL
jgi:hypothetical protein